MESSPFKTVMFVLTTVVCALTLVLVGFGVGWVLSGWQVANLREESGSPPVTTTVETPDAALPTADLPGEDLPGLPRYPGSVRDEYQQRAVEGGLILVEAKYVVAAEPEEVREFYRAAFQSEDWRVVDLDFSRGEWDFLVTKGQREAAIEIRSEGRLVEMEIEMSELQRDGEAQKVPTSPQRPEEATPTPSYTPPSNDDDDFGDDFDDGYDEFEGD